MQQTTIGNVLDHTVPFESDNAEDYCMYVIRDGDLCLYIGQSSNVYQRLDRHLGIGGRNSPSGIGEIVYGNIPDSRNWIVEFRTLAECGELMGCQYKKGRVDEAEEAMVKRYQPCANIALNPHPTPLPSKYRQYQDVAMLERTSISDCLFEGSEWAATYMRESKVDWDALSKRIQRRD